MRHNRRLLLLVIVAALAGGGLLTSSPGVTGQSSIDSSTHETQVDRHIVTVTPGSTDRLWPYTSRTRSFETATLPINVVVQEDPTFVRYLLTQTEGATWRVSQPRNANASATAGNGTPPVDADLPEDNPVVLNGTRIAWSDAEGSTRYTYIHNTSTGRGRWVAETYQLHDGSYFGTREHIRMYGGGTEDTEWTAIQVHSEHWDWFRIRHTVDGLGRAQHNLEQEFFGMWFLDEVTRVRFANDGALDSDGWVTLIQINDYGKRAAHPLFITWLLGAIIVQLSVTVAISRRVRSARQWLRGWNRAPGSGVYLVALLLLPLFVRMGSVTLESTIPRVSPQVIVAVFFPILVVGTPLLTIALSRRLPPHESVIAATAAFGFGQLLDYLYLSISVLQIGIVTHRMALLLIIGALATGAARTSPEERPLNRYVVAAVSLWVFSIILPHLPHLNLL